MPCTGSWTEPACVNSKLIKSVAEMLAGQESILLSIENDLLVIKGRSSTSRIPRSNSAGLNVHIPIRRREAKKKKPRYQPYINPVSTEKKAEYGDTWGFSARVPLPAEAYKDRPKTDWDKE